MRHDKIIVADTTAAGARIPPENQAETAPVVQQHFWFSGNGNARSSRTFAIAPHRQ